MSESKMTLWSLRYSICRGAIVVAERDCDAETAAAWLDVFRQDEPSVPFMLASYRPTPKTFEVPA